MKKFALTCIVNFAALYVIALIFPQISVESLGAAFWAGFILTIVNFIIRPIVMVLTFPINIITLGLFILIVNTWMVMLTDTVIKGIKIPGFWLSFATALVVSAFNMIVQCLFERKEHD